MENIKGTFKNEEKETIFRLAHFNPTASDEYGNQVIDYLVVDALTGFGPLLPVTAAEIKSYIKSTYHLDFEVAEINVTGRRLGRRKMVKFSGSIQKEEKGEKSRFQILPVTKEKIEKNLSSIKELEKKVMDEWKEEICYRYKEYPIIKERIDSIEESFHRFVSKMFIRHGVECVAILYPDNRKAQQWLNSVGDSIFLDFSDIDSLINSIIKVEIPKFFQSLNFERKQYITNLFNGSFFWHMIQVDGKCSRLLQSVTKGQKLFLDNNILYSLVGLHGSYLLKSVHNILKIAKRLGYKLLVTSKTTDEFKESLSHRIKEIKHISRELARIAVKNLDENNFMVCYWKEFVKNGIGIEEFIAEKSHLENVLDGLGIDKIHKFRKDIESSDELLREESLLQQAAPKGTNEHIIEHDAFHRILVRKIRREEKYNFSEAAAWFLTHDTKLPTYDRIARKGKTSLPFCLLTSQWVQINRPLLTRTSDENEYEESYNALVTQPYLRAMLSSFPIERAYNEVLGRLNRYENLNPQFALNIVTDVHFMSTITSENDKEKIEEKIENKFVDVSIELQKEKEKLTEDVVQKGENVKKLEKRMSSLEKKFEEAQNEHQTQTENLKKELENEKKKRENAEQEAKNAYEELEKFKKKIAEKELRRSAKRRLAITFAIFIFLELFFFWKAVQYGEGKNLWQKSTSLYPFIFIVPPILSLILGWFIIGKKRLISLGWLWTKIFKIKYDENNKE